MMLCNGQCGQGVNSKYNQSLAQKGVGSQKAQREKYKIPDSL